MSSNQYLVFINTIWADYSIDKGIEDTTSFNSTWLKVSGLNHFINPITEQHYVLPSYFLLCRFACFCLAVYQVGYRYNSSMCHCCFRKEKMLCILHKIIWKVWQNFDIFWFIYVFTGFSSSSDKFIWYKASFILPRYLLHLLHDYHKLVKQPLDHCPFMIKGHLHVG